MNPLLRGKEVIMKKIMELDVRELVIRNECFMHRDYLKKAPEWAIPKWESNPDKNDTTTIRLPDGTSLKMVEDKSTEFFFNTPNIMDESGLFTHRYYELYEKDEKLGYAIPVGQVIEGILFF